MTYALLSMSERHGLLAGIMCAGASPVPACAELTQPPAWFFAAVARPCLWAVGVQLPPHLAASASCCVTRRSCCGGSLRRRRPACRGSLASELLSRRGPCRRPGRKSTTAGGTTAKMASCFLICRVFAFTTSRHRAHARAATELSSVLCAMSLIVTRHHPTITTLVVLGARLRPAPLGSGRIGGLGQAGRAPLVPVATCPKIQLPNLQGLGGPPGLSLVTQNKQSLLTGREVRDAD